MEKELQKKVEEKLEDEKEEKEREERAVELSKMSDERRNKLKNMNKDDPIE